MRPFVLLLVLSSLSACTAEQSQKASAVADRAVAEADKAVQVARCVNDVSKPYVGKPLTVDGAQALAASLKACDPR